MTEELVDNVIKLYAAGDRTVYSIAKELGIQATQAWRVINYTERCVIKQTATNSLITWFRSLTKQQQDFYKAAMKSLSREKAKQFLTDEYNGRTV